MEQHWVTIPLEEFETLHWEIRNGTASLQSLQRGYNRLYAECQRSELEAEALIALLRVQLHEHDPQSCGQCSGHPLDKFDAQEP